MKRKECKVKYVNDLETGIEVKCTEFEVKTNYRIYVYDKGYKLLEVKKTKQEALNLIDNIRNKYEDYMVIEHDYINDCDMPIMIKGREER